jgi:hypothetical protein
MDSARNVTRSTVTAFATGQRLARVKISRHLIPTWRIVEVACIFALAVPETGTRLERSSAFTDKHKEPVP